MLQKAEILRTLQSLIEENFKMHRDSQFYADQLNIHLKTLNRLVKHYRGKSVAQMIDDRLHTEAIFLLINTDYPMKYIAHELDYCDPSHFTRVFRRMKGIAPIEFRKIHEN